MKRNQEIAAAGIVVESMVQRCCKQMGIGKVFEWATGLKLLTSALGAKKDSLIIVHGFVWTALPFTVKKIGFSKMEYGRLASV